MGEKCFSLETYLDIYRFIKTLVDILWLKNLKNGLQFSNSSWLMSSDWLYNKAKWNIKKCNIKKMNVF